jgi:hypothetical protein
MLHENAMGSLEIFELYVLIDSCLEAAFTEVSDCNVALKEDLWEVQAILDKVVHICLFTLRLALHGSLHKAK